MAVFGLGVLFGKVKFGKSREIYIEICVGTLLLCFFVIRNFRGTHSSDDMLKRYMVREGL